MNLEHAGGRLRSGLQRAQSVSSQAMVPSPGQRCASLSPWLSWMCEERMVAAQLADGGADAVAEMGVAGIETDANVLKVAGGENLDQVCGAGDFALKIFDEDFDAERDWQRRAGVRAR